MLHLPVSKLQKLKKYIICNNLIYPNLEWVSGVDPVKSAFESCDHDRNMDLTQEELHQDHCFETLEKFFGLTEEGLDEIFPKIDTNADLKISLEEGQAAFESNKVLNRKWYENIWRVFSTVDMSESEEETVRDIVDDVVFVDSYIKQALDYIRLALDDRLEGSNWGCIYARDGVNRGYLDSWTPDWVSNFRQKKYVALWRKKKLNSWDKTFDVEYVICMLFE